MEGEFMRQEALVEKNHQAEKKEAFAGQQAFIDEIKRVGFGRYAESLPNLADAFDLEKHKVENFSHAICCMDERTPCGIHAAGSGILLPPKDFETYMQATQPDLLTSHDNCGAGKLYCLAHGLPVENSDQIARAWAEEQAKKYGLPHRHLAVKKDFHFARACYYDLTGQLNNDLAAGLPDGFVISRAYMNKKNSLHEAKIALDIIFGDHGLGKEFLTAGNPFLVTAVAWDEGELKAIKKELAELENPYDDLVRFEAFLAPLPE